MKTQIISESEERLARAGIASEPRPAQASGVSSPTMLETLSLFARNKWLIAKVTVGATVIGVIVSLVWPVRYTATTEIMTPQQTEPAAMMMSQFGNNAMGSMAALASGGLSLKSPNDVYIGILGSRPIVDALIQKFDLRKLYSSRDMTAARKKLAQYTIIASEKSGLISVAVTDRDKVRAAEMANTYIEQLRNLTQSIAATEASQRRQFFEAQLKEAKDDLVNAEADFQRVQQTKGVIQPADQAKVIIQSQAEIRAAITAKKVELESLRSYSTDRNPQVLIAENQLASLQAAENSIEQKQHSGGFGNLGLGDVPGAGLEYLKAQHELLYRQTLFDLLIKQYDAAKIDEAKEATVIRVVTPAIPPDRKSSPLRTVIVLISFLAGLVFVCAYIYWIDLMRRDPELKQSLIDFRSALAGK